MEGVVLTRAVGLYGALGVQGVRIALIVTAALFLTVLVIWVVLMAATAPKGTTDQQLARLRAGSRLYQLNFVNASLLAPTVVTLLALLLAIPGRRPAGALDIAGMTFAAAYAALVTIAYTSQYAVLPRLLRSGRDPVPWYFGSRDSYPYYLALLGYALFGFGAALLSVAFLGQPGLWRWVGIVLLASGVASVAGFAGYASGQRALETGSVIGGVLCLPLAVLVLVGAIQL